MMKYTVRELAGKCGYAPTTVRDWIALFHDFIPHHKDESGVIFYDDESVEIIHYIKKLRDRKIRKNNMINFLKEYSQPLSEKEIDIRLSKHFKHKGTHPPTPSEFTIPYLNILSDRKIRHVSEINEALADFFSIQGQQKEIYLHSGDSKFKIRARYARRELQVAGLLEQPEQNTYQITDLGLKVFKQFPHGANMPLISKFLKELSEDNTEDIVDVGESAEIFTMEDDNEDESTPTEIMDEQFKRINNLLALEILEQIKKINPKRFEEIVLDLLLAMGYGGTLGSGQTTDYVKDEGVDAIIKEDKLGLDIIYVQAKRWKGNVGRPEIQAFTGSLEGKKARKGVFITTSKFTREAEEFVKHIEKKIILIDGELLGKYMLEHNVGVSIESKYIVKKIDSDYFKIEE
ncbi:MULTISPECIES: restriction endonuclease [Bacillaceae]|uniref:restriction endonuclease n=1 Tax=Bacillaceae TaxID=186817 RepID=UPI002964E907|nr:restriction endonuclease [Bacillus infantis]MDW2876816.1 restriction endonuclease [Bacillus infantis]